MHLTNFSFWNNELLLPISPEIRLLRCTFLRVNLFTHPQSGEVLIVLTLEKPGFSCYPRSFSSSDARRDVHQRLPP